MIFSLLYFTWLFVYIKRNVFFSRGLTKTNYTKLVMSTSVIPFGDQGTWNEPVNIAATYGFIVKSMIHWS